MAFRYHSLRRISALYSGLRFHECGQVSNLSASLIPKTHTLEDVASDMCRAIHASRFSTVAAISKEISCELDLVSFIRSTSDCAEDIKDTKVILPPYHNDLPTSIKYSSHILEKVGRSLWCGGSIFNVLVLGPYHCWINRFEGDSEFLQKDGAYLLLAESFLDNPPGSRGDRIVMLQKVKLLQQRYPWLHVFGFQSCSSMSSEVDRSLLMDKIMEEYITFPILLCSKNFPELASGACCILLKGLKSPPLYDQNVVDLCTLDKAIKDLNKQLVQDAGNAGKFRCSWSKKTEGFKEPYICSYLQNLPLSLPACISADEQRNQFFLSDSNHHRVIVFDNTGKILDAIGSSPGYEDGDFEIAKLMRPAASWYHASEDCLYLVDSENHAIRRADLGKRVLETLYPSCADNGRSGLWSWILDKVGFSREAGMKPVELDQATLLFPWHLLKSKDNDLLVMNRSFETLWIVDLDSGKVRDVVKGHGEVMEFCGKQIMEKVSDLQSLSSDILQQLFNSSHTLGGNQNSHFDFLSSFVTTGEDQLVCDTVGQRVLMLNKQAEVALSVDFSNFGILGLPYWLSYSLERVFPCGNTWGKAIFDHLQAFSLLPGKVDVHTAISIPDNTELVEPLQEHCVWRQARGAAMEVPEMETSAETSDKVGAAQKWYDDLDNLAFETEQEESKEESRPRIDFQDGKIHIDCVLQTSPGTSEVVISAPLYLKLRSSGKTCGKSQDMMAAEIADILKPRRNGRLKRDTFIRLLLKLNRDLGDLVFIKPLHVKVTFDTLNLPKTENPRDIIVTDATVDVNVVL